MTELATNVLDCGDNLEILPRYLPDARVHLISLDAPFNLDLGTTLRGVRRLDYPRALWES